MKKSEPQILPGLPQELGYTTVGTQSSDAQGLIERFLLMSSVIMDNAPLHIAVHLIRNIDSPPAPYAHIHCHPKCDEIGLVLASKDELEFEIILDGKENTVKSPAAIYIPAGTYHRARALAGNGTYVCILLDPKGPCADNVVVAE